jgi:acetyl-CoA/propionyl-CoA carboxylase, biotin carboxylase, biotin carboxyl carrier protein
MTAGRTGAAAPRQPRRVVRIGCAGQRDPADPVAPGRPQQRVAAVGGTDQEVVAQMDGAGEMGSDDRRRITKVLIANRGEIAVRIARACADAGIGSVAVYADPDRDGLHVRTADEAYALGGSTPGDSYLLSDKLIEVARRSGADAVHPGYGFLSENAGFAQAVLDAGLTWIGPSPAAIDALGDKVSARHIAERAGAPLVSGTKDPVSGADEVLAFADQHGLPVAIKAAYGGGGRGLKVARERAEIAELYDSAVREAVAAFGRGECFVETYLDRPRHVETQCLADTHGNVVVVSTRDCSLQRRHQKLVEEAPAPFLTQEQNDRIYQASKAILREAGYTGAGTCEFLVGQDGTISFLEVNTRLQVEHPVSEEVTGLDLVREQLRIAAGEELGYDDPPVRGHSLEFRINGEDAGRGFLPAPGSVTRFDPPSGPGVRLDSGVVAGDVIGGSFDSMLAKLVVTGATRRQALERARRALDEFVIEGMATVLPFHRVVVRDPAFAPASDDVPFRVHTRWIETEFANAIAPFAGPAAAAAGPGSASPSSARRPIVVEVDGKRLEVVLPEGFSLGAGAGGPSGAGGPTRARAPRRSGRATSAAADGSDAVVAPMQGTIVKIAVEEGQTVQTGDLLVVLEAMKMEQPITAPKAGVVTGLTAVVGQTVTSGAALLDLKDA